jgi:uncharacterized membrane protein YdbT with pleckstrin-like domain
MYGRDMDLHPGEVVVFDGHPSPRAALSFFAPFFLVIVVIAVIVGLVASVGLAIVVFVVLTAIMVAVGFIKRAATDYVVSTQRLYIRQGILSKRVQQTRITRVQNVNTNQTLMDRLMRVGNIDFDTAGTDDSEFRFVGISDPHSVVAAVDKAQRDAEGTERSATQGL